MRQILQMWFMVLYFKWNQKWLASLNQAQDTLYEDALKLSGRVQAEILMARINNNKPMVAPHVLKEQFTLFYYLDYWKVRRSRNRYVEPKKNPNYAERLRFVNTILQNCLSDTHKFFDHPDGKQKEDEKDMWRIYITADGEKFATFIGLFREWAIFLNPFGSAAVTALIGIAIAYWPYLINLLATR